MSFDLSLRTDRQLKQMDKQRESPDWNANPSFNCSSAIKSVDTFIRTFDIYLAEVGRQAIAEGFLLESDLICRMNAPTQATGQDGLSWDNNPTYAATETPTSLASPSFFTEDIDESPHCVESSRNRCPFNRKSFCIDAATVREHCTVPSKRPWMDSGRTIEWLEMINMHHVAVQTEPDLLDDDETAQRSPALGLSRKMNAGELDTPISLPRCCAIESEDRHVFVFDPTEDTEANVMNHRGTSGSLQWTKGSSFHATHDTASADVMFDDGITSPKNPSLEARRLSVSPERNRGSVKNRLKLGCSISLESDAFNNLPLMSDGEHSKSGEPSIRHVRNMSQESMRSSFGRKCETKRLELMEQELRELRKRIMDLEIDLCNKDSIIAQQDAVIHHFKANLKSKRLHQRNYSSPYAQPWTAMDCDGSSLSTRHRQPLQSNSIAFDETANGKTDVQGLIATQQAQIKSLMKTLENCHVE